MTHPLIIAVDFDGTIVKHEYPDIGAPVPGALETLRDWVSRGFRIILWTMRSGETLQMAIDYLDAHGVELWGVNANPDQRETKWSTSPKAYAHKYVDDAAVGCPLRQGPFDSRPYVDWSKISLLPDIDFRPTQDR